MHKAKKLISLLVLFTVLLATFASLPAAAEAPEETTEADMGIMWTYITTISPTLSISGTTATYGGNCTGRSGATYHVTVYLYRSNGTVAAGPLFGGPGSNSAAAGSSASIAKNDGYYTRVYAYAYVDGRLVESASAETPWKYA